MEFRVEVDRRRMKLNGESIPNPPWLKMIKKFVVRFFHIQICKSSSNFS
jgi:hypothetical protein